MEARLEPVGSSLAPVTDGWFVLNVADAAWLTNEAFGARCVFEANGAVVRARPELDVRRFAQLGITLAVLEPGKPSRLYHAESSQEDFLVLAGECLLIVEGEERRLRVWDFVHCPPGTEHGLVGAGTGPCVVLMTGARFGETETASPREAYAPFGHWQPGRPDGWAALPWAGRET